MVIERRAARALLIAGRSVLLIRGCDPARPELGDWWLTPGGGIEAGESFEVAVAREVREETGLDLPPDQFGACVATRVAEFDFDGQPYHQREWFFAARVTRFVPAADGWDAIEQRALLDHRWWTLDELLATDDLVYPRELAAVMQAVLDGPVEPPLQLAGDRSDPAPGS
jgi:8-oxo-dGTP pyrophosphatase MutT (NUDIX family)